ncbi:MAG: site-specific integrase [Gammaproteobacteria bacterium]|nr:site-specific integrase [Gammaproteobacteria bacterium]
MEGVRRAAALTPDEMKRMVDAAPVEPRGMRDAAMVALGYSCALRRSEIAALDVEDLRMVVGGRTPVPRQGEDPVDPGARCLVRIRRSKTDQAGRGYDIPLEEGSRLRPLQLLQWWLIEARITHGPLFRAIRGHEVQAGRIQGHDVDRAVKRLAAAAGVDVEPLSAHSLRSGFITAAVEAGADLDQVMKVSRHKSYESVLDYVRRRDLFRDYAGTFL